MKNTTISKPARKFCHSWDLYCCIDFTVDLEVFEFLLSRRLFVKSSQSTFLTIPASETWERDAPAEAGVVRRREPDQRGRREAEARQRHLAADAQPSKRRLSRSLPVIELERAQNVRARALKYSALSPWGFAKYGC